MLGNGGPGLSHPDFEHLLAFAAGELPSDQQASLESHLARCAECSVEANRLKASMSAPASAPARSLPSSVLEEIRSWEDAHTDRDSGVSEIKARVEGEIAPYIGSASAARIMERISPDGTDLLARIEAVLTLFLGGTAAAELTSRIVDRSIVRP